MMPEVNGFDVVEALNVDPATARIPIVVVTAKKITVEDRIRLDGYVTTIVEKAFFDGRALHDGGPTGDGGPVRGRLTWPTC